MKTVTICGSMRFTNEMKSIAYYLETQQNSMFFNVYIFQIMLFRQMKILRFWKWLIIVKLI